jgi:LPXTG-motif cell wall-anchored protein
MIFRNQILFLLTLFFAQLAGAQGGATIKASVDKNKILIGEPFHLIIEANLSPESVISFVNVDTIEHFEFAGKPVIDTINKEGSTTIKGVYKLTSFDSGHWVIPSFILSPAVKTDTIPIDVVFSDFNSNQDYHDIKDIIEVKPEEKKQWWLYAAGGALLLLLLLIYLLRKKKPQPALVIKENINPYEEAMKQLEQLQKDKLETKQLHSKLTDIFRLYIFRKKGILSLQKTTDDLVLQLESLNLDKEQFDRFSQSLRLSDFVKFAKYVPSNDDNRNCLEEIKNAIVTIEKTEAKIPL